MRGAFEGAMLAVTFIVCGTVGGLIGWGLGAFFWYAGTWIAAPITVVAIIALGAVAGHLDARERSEPPQSPPEPL